MVRSFLLCLLSRAPYREHRGYGTRSLVSRIPRRWLLARRHSAKRARQCSMMVNAAVTIAFFSPVTLLVPSLRSMYRSHIGGRSPSTTTTTGNQANQRCMEAPEFNASRW